MFPRRRASFSGQVKPHPAGWGQLASILACPAGRDLRHADGSVAYEQSSRFSDKLDLMQNRAAVVGPTGFIGDLTPKRSPPRGNGANRNVFLTIASMERDWRANVLEPQWAKGLALPKIFQNAPPLEAGINWHPLSFPPWSDCDAVSGGWGLLRLWKHSLDGRS